MSLVWCSGYSVGHINRVKLRRARLVLGLMTTFGGPAIVVFFRPTQPGHPSMVGAMTTGCGFGHCWGRYDEFSVVVGLATRADDILSYTLAKLGLTDSKVKRDELPRDGPHAHGTLALRPNSHTQPRSAV